MAGGVGVGSDIFLQGRADAGPETGRAGSIPGLGLEVLSWLAPQNVCVFPLALVAKQLILKPGKFCLALEEPAGAVALYPHICLASTPSRDAGLPPPHFFAKSPCKSRWQKVECFVFGSAETLLFFSLQCLGLFDNCVLLKKMLFKKML